MNAYAVVFAGLLLPAGALGDRLGRKGVLLAGLLVFGAASVGAAFVESPGALIALRAVSGVGAAMACWYREWYSAHVELANAAVHGDRRSSLGVAV